jgi:hypothetical protein
MGLGERLGGGAGGLIDLMNGGTTVSFGAEFLGQDDGSARGGLWRLLNHNFSRLGGSLPQIVSNFYWDISIIYRDEFIEV